MVEIVCLASCDYRKVDRDRCSAWSVENQIDVRVLVELSMDKAYPTAKIVSWMSGGEERRLEPSYLTNRLDRDVRGSRVR